MLLWLTQPWNPTGTGDNTKLIRAVFQSEHNKKIIYRPLGELPFLKMGYFYSNGRLDKISSKLKSFSFSIKNCSSPVFYSAKSCLPADFFQFGSGKDTVYGNDFCAIYRSKEYNYIIPCMEIIRAVAGTHSFLISTLFSTRSLADYVHYEETDEQLHLTLREDGYNKYPSSMLNNAAIYEFANFAFNPILRNWWDEISEGQKADPSKRIKTGFPQSSQLFIRGYGLQQGRDIILLHIDADHIPMLEKKIIAEHSSFYKKKKDSASSEHTGFKENEFSDVISLTDDPISRNSNISVTTADNPNRYASNPLIVRQKIEMDGRNRMLCKDVEKDEIKGSMSDTVYGGKVPHVEVLPDRSEKIPIRPGFEQFCKAINYLGIHRHISNLSIQYHKTGVQVYAVATGSFRTRPFMIIEFPPEKIDLSTLIIRNCNDEARVERLAVTSLRNHNMHWDRSDLKSLQLNLYLLRHTEYRSPQTFAELLRKHLE